MADHSEQFSDFTLHIVLATIPQKQEKVFDDSVKKLFYGKYRSGAKHFFSQPQQDYWSTKEDPKIPILYNPIRYYILGNYDIAYISLIDNFKFAQRLFEPEQDEDDPKSPDLFSPHTFQSFTGITHCSSKENESVSDYLKQFFFDRLKDAPVRKYFMAICNLKLNNGILIGNGKHYLRAVLKKIDAIVAKENEDHPDKQIDHLALQSFSWFEISLLIFTDDPAQISDLMTQLRRLSIDKLDEYQELLDRSLYREMLPGDATKMGGVNVFADTHTYFGIHSDLVTEDLSNTYVREFLEKDITLTTGVEWQVKPGHMHLLKPVLEDFINDKNDKIFNLKEKFLMAGKSDYLLNLPSDRVNNNIYLMRRIIDPDCPLFSHVRKIKTRLLFKLDRPDSEERPVLNLHEELQKLAVKNDAIKKIDRNLKALKVSRQIRSKILKIFSNYNNGIQDIILFPFFLDFYNFIEELQVDINKIFKIWQERFTASGVYDFSDEKVSRLEDRLMKLIMIFQEAYNIRMLNCYQFEDINDFDLDFNSSIQQLLSAYSSLAFEMGNLFYADEYKYGPIVQLNLKDTVSNYSSINYHVHHLTSPEFVFATLTKEMLNFVSEESAEYKDILKIYEDNQDAIRLSSETLDDLIESRLADINYFLNDAVRYVVTYDADFKLFEFWFWTYNFQNSSLYDVSGSINEQHLQKEIFRILFIHKYFNVRDHEVKCPLPEIFTYWDRHFNSIKAACDCYFEELNKLNILSMFMNFLMSVFKTSLTSSLKGVTVPLGDVIAANQKLLKIKGSHPINISELRDRYAEKTYAFENIRHLKAGDTAFIVPEDSLLYMQAKMMQYLVRIYDLNGGKVSLTRRDWKSGMPLISFIVADEQPHLYSVDQSGGIFFDDMKNMNKYFKLSSEALTAIWHYSLMRKKNFIKHKKAIKAQKASN